MLTPGLADTKKPAQRLACLADYTGKISNLLEDYKKVDIFAQIVGPTRYSDGYSDIYSDVKK